MFPLLAERKGNMLTDKMVVILFGFMFIMGIIGLLIPTPADPFMVAGKIFLGIMLIVAVVVVVACIVWKLREE